MAVPDVLIAVDPGGTTGVAVYDHKLGRAVVGMQFTPWVAVRFVEEYLEVRENVCVVCEKFTVTAATIKLSRQDEAMKVNGAIEYLCVKHEHTYEEQTPATAKKIGGDPTLKDMCLFTPGRGHANDAARHLVLGIERRYPGLLDDDSLFGYNGSIVIVNNRSN